MEGRAERVDDVAVNTAFAGLVNEKYGVDYPVDFFLVNASFRLSAGPGLRSGRGGLHRFTDKVAVRREPRRRLVRGHRAGLASPVPASSVSP